MNRLLLVIMVSLLAGCQSAQVESTEKSEKTIAVTDFSGRELQFDIPPERIAVLANGELDLLYALGGEAVGRPKSDNIVVESTSSLPQIGTTHEVDVERLTLVTPDLVLGNSPMNEKDIQIVESIGSDILLTSANSVHEIQLQVEIIGQLLEKEQEADELNAKMEQVIKALAEQPIDHPPRVLLVYGAPGSTMVALPNSLAGNILELAGGENIAADFEQLDAFPQYAPLHPERVIEARPDLVFFMAHGDVEAAKEGFIKEMEQHSTWSSVEAVQNDQMHILPNDLFGTNPGSRVTEALEYMREQLEAVSE